ncbi:MAG: hypothetical protein RIS11_1516 [Pseudomonadota bacterium]|jgi:hypothetical protein|uniref:hypothetical protein n=1 Tax=Sphingorhabdus sp. TaxID=1902408 RepID=UPI0034F5762B
MPVIETIALLLLTPAAAPAADAAEAAPTMAAAPQAKTKAKKICKNDPRRTGTRISKRICKTEEEWNTPEDGQEIGVRSQTSRADMENVGGMGQP